MGYNFFHPKASVHFEKNLNDICTIPEIHITLSSFFTAITNNTNPFIQPKHNTKPQLLDTSTTNVLSSACVRARSVDELPIHKPEEEREKDASVPGLIVVSLNNAGVVSSHSYLPVGRPTHFSRVSA